MHIKIKQMKVIQLKIDILYAPGGVNRKTGMTEKWNLFRGQMKKGQSDKKKS